MIEIGGGEKEYTGLGGENLAERFSYADQLVKANGAKSNRNKCEAGIPDLQKRKLDFKGMFALVGDRIFAKQRASERNFCRELDVNCDIAEGSAPRAFRQDGGFLALGEMANSEDDDAFGKCNAFVNRGGNMSRICVARVRHKTRLAGDFLVHGFRTRKILNLFGERARIGGIKRAGDSGKAKHSRSMNQLAFEGLPLTLRAFLLSGSKKTVTLSPY